jgi:5-methylcytosine-specific restriction endonuclease McrA
MSQKPPRKKKTQKNAPLAQETDLSKSSLPEDSSIDALSAIIKAAESTEADNNRNKEQSLDSQEALKLTDDAFEKELRKFLIPKLRSASYRWHHRSQAIKDARVARGLYKCAMCHREDLKNGEYAVDHTESVVPLSGWDGDWNVYIKRMYVKAEQFQILCETCHTIKTDSEVQIRKMYRERKKKEQKT